VRADGSPGVVRPGATGELETALATIAKAHSGLLGLAATNLRTGEQVALNADEVLPTASVIKLPILVELLHQAEQGGSSLDDRVTMAAEERIGGSGILKVLDGELTPTVRDVATLMVVVSDNTATNMAIDVLGGVEAVNTHMRTLGLETIVLHNRIDFDLIGDDVRRLGESSARDMCRLAELLARGQAVSPAADELILDILGRQQYLDQVPRYFDYNPYWRELGATVNLSVASKTGFFTGTRVDAGVVSFNPGRGDASGGLDGFAYAVFNHEGDDETFLPEAEGAVTNGRVGKVLLSYWWPPEAGPAPLRASAYDL
jgi:beta-lactamase class A